MPANLENSTVDTGLEKVSFHSIPKKGNAKECSNYHTIALISHTRKVMLKIFQLYISGHLKYGTTDWFQIGKGVRQSCILSPCLFNLYEEYSMRNAGLKEAQAGIKIARRNINNVRYRNDTILMAESEELKSLMIK